MRYWFVFTPLLMLAAGCSNTPQQNNAQNPAANTAQSAPAPAAVPGPGAAPPAAGPPPPVAATPAAPDPEPVSREVQVSPPKGAALRVRLDHSLDTKKNDSGDSFTATLSKPVVVRGETIIPAGTRFRGHLTAADSSGRLKGRPVIGLTLDSFHLHGKDYRIRTTSVQRVGAAHKKRNAVLIGGGAGLGAALGAIAGGGKGAAIGAAAGAGAGTAGAYATGKQELRLPAETPLVFTIR